MSPGAQPSVGQDDDREWVLLCEGFHDRAFLAGIFETVCGFEPLKGPRSPVKGSGHYGYRNVLGEVIRVVPCEAQADEQGVWAQGRRYLKQRATRPLHGLVLVLDEDLASQDKAKTASEAVVRARQRLVKLAEPFGPLDEAVDGGSIVLSDHTRLSAIAWATDATTEEAPPVQCLERVVAVAMAAVFPRRAAQVNAWLGGRDEPPDSPAAVNKAYTWSHMAGWYADRGCEGFLKTLWRERALADELRRRLHASGAWTEIEFIAGRSRS